MSLFKKLILFTSIPCFTFGSYWYLNPDKFHQHKLIINKIINPNIENDEK